jgi:LmbE family N-acetylglucosaminyl deacetylase
LRGSLNLASLDHFVPTAPRNWPNRPLPGLFEVDPPLSCAPEVGLRVAHGRPWDARDNRPRRHRREDVTSSEAGHVGVLRRRLQRGPLATALVTCAALVLAGCEHDGPTSHMSGAAEAAAAAGTPACTSSTTHVETDFPFDVATGAPVCPPYDRPAVFFSPHQDDESIGMSGSIAAEVAAGRQVFLELMTGGQESAARITLANGGRDSWHPGRHTYSLTIAQFSLARTKEFLDAAARLHVTGVFLNGFEENHLTTDQVTRRVNFWKRWGGDGLSLHGTAGAEDPGSPTIGPHPDHVAVWTALNQSGVRDITGHLIYQYRTHLGTYDERVDFTGLCQARQNALAAYKVWNPSQGRYAIGYHSVRTLFDSSAADCAEYLLHRPHLRGQALGSVSHTLLAGRRLRRFHLLSYSSWRRNQNPVSLRPRGARSSH